VTRPYPELRTELHRFLLAAGSPAALIRHDKQLEAPPMPRGGFLVSERLLPEAMRFFFDLDRIVAVYEMANPLLNAHNINLLFESESDVWIEVVGPGFDASDIQRGDFSPHETFSVSLSPRGEISSFKLLQRVDQTTYEKSQRSRKDKIRKKLESSPSEELALKIRVDLGIPDNLDSYLQTIGSPLFQSEKYVPLSEQLLRKTVMAILDSGIINRYSALTGIRFPLVFSTSLVNRGTKQVFWDIVSPALKFEGLTGKS
jgi:hypothetical protein